MLKKSLIILSLGLISCSSSGKEEEKKTEKPIPVLTVAVQKPLIRQVNKRLSVTGSVYPVEVVNIQPEINGLKVVSIIRAEGDFVKKGEVLARLDYRLLNSQLDNYRIKSLSAREQLNKLKNPSRHQDITRNQAALRQSEAAYQEAVNNEIRYKNLYLSGAISRSDWESRVTALKTAREAYQQQKALLNLVADTSRPEDIRIAMLNIRELENLIEQTKIQLSQTSIIAPSAGLIITKKINLGDISTFGAEFFTLVKDGQLELRASVPESELEAIKINSPVKISSDMIKNLNITGNVREISPVIDPENRQSTIKITIPASGRLKPGQFIKGEILLGSKSALTVPVSAVINKDGQSYLFILEKERAKLQKIQLAHKDAEFVEVSNGIMPMHQVIIDGVGFLKDGDYVKAVGKG